MPEPWALWAHDTEAHLLVLYLPQAFQYQCGPGHAKKQDSQSGIPMEVAKLKKSIPEIRLSHCCRMGEMGTLEREGRGYALATLCGQGNVLELISGTRCVQDIQVGL